MITFDILVDDGSTVRFVVNKIYTNKRYSNYYSVPTDGYIYYLSISHKIRKGVVKVKMSLYTQKIVKYVSGRPITESFAIAQRNRVISIS